MKKLELSIFGRLALSIIGIIIIPIVVLITGEIRNRVNLDLEEKKEESLRNLNSVYTKLVETNTVLESIKLIVDKDVPLLDFITAEKPHTWPDYVEFERSVLKNYQRILLLSKDIKYFRLYVDNKDNLLSLQPYIYSSIPLNKKMVNESKIIFKDGKPFLYYFREIYYFPKKVYLEMEVDISEIFKDKISDYYFISNNNTNIIDLKIQEDVKSIITNQSFDKEKKILIVPEKDKLYFICKMPFSDSLLIKVQNYKNFIDLSYLGYLILIAIFTLTVIYFISYMLAKKIFNQLDLIFSAVQQIKKGNLKISFSKKFDNKEFNELAEQLIAMGDNIERLILENLKSKDLIYDFQMKALQSQINSHFLQNSMESIKMMAYLNKDYEVSDSLLYLGKILRYGMEWKNPIVNIKDEVEYLTQYIKLFSIRMEHELSFRLYIEEDLNMLKIPKMSLQPLIENSIIHGIIPKDSKGYIQLRIYKKNKNIMFDILDNGKGIADNKYLNDSKSIGMDNVIKRLELFYERKIEFEISSERDKFTRIKFIIEGCENYEKNNDCR